MGNKAQKTLNGVDYRISQDMVRVRRLGWTEWFGRKVFTKYIGLPILTILSPLWYFLLGNFAWAREVMSQITWIFTPWTDQALADVKQELVKDSKGKRVLDVGSAGAGDWLKYLEGASEVTELEPNSMHVKVLNNTVDQFRQGHPGTKVEIVNASLEHFKADPYDVSGFVSIC